MGSGWVKQIVLIAAIVFAACAAIASEYAGMRVAFMALKPLTTILIIALFWQLANGLGSIELRVMFGALCLCLLGDTLLLFDALFVFGLTAFLFAHLGFIVVFARAYGLRLSWFPTLVIGSAAVGYFSLLFPHLGVLTVPVAVYLSVIISMVLCAVGMASYSGSAVARGVALGAIVFAISDSVIAYNKFLQPVWWSSLVILSFYWLAMTLLAMLVPPLLKQAHIERGSRL
ncbi:hypothetical protein GCM10008090_30360 [Arenicella chitinivorans]|uniref:Lysoplasmalogenase n=1 Tax=Arenicella chitinivorans TaxID=1329800 RepID=A0A918VQ43_9GAMM|nr:lysoplasmalogenase [Arenicella chitinivorans]GHA18682.1 hypothetical protein GCM10008090_30360 [Arenicella chitinivorans]